VFGSPLPSFYPRPVPCRECRLFVGCRACFFTGPAGAVCPCEDWFLSASCPFPQRRVSFATFVVPVVAVIVGRGLTGVAPLPPDVFFPRAPSKATFVATAPISFFVLPRGRLLLERILLFASLPYGRGTAIFALVCIWHPVAVGCPVK